METFEDDEDTHYCIKCHITLTGLDNYIHHRQAGCRPPEPKHDISYPEVLNADTFFSSLELRSSVKSKTIDIQKKPTSEEKRNKKDVKKYSEVDDSSNKIELTTLSPGVGDLDDPTDQIGIPSLVGFPDLVAFPEKASVTSIQTPKSQMKKKGEGWSDIDLEDLGASKDSADIMNSDPDYGSVDSEVESSNNNMQESYSESDEERGYPEQAHIGGKWKPGQLLQAMETINEEEEEDDDRQEYRMLPAHTGGKWKPTEKANENEPPPLPDEDDEDEDEDKNTRRPPLDHTRGNLDPAASLITGEPATANRNYWCPFCHRRLSSKLLYDRHLKSDLHARRSIQEIEWGNIWSARTIGTLLTKRTRSKTQRAFVPKSSDKKKEPSTKNKQQRRRRNRDKLIIRCEMCGSRVRCLQLGKHLLSHYHCRVAGLNANSSPSEYRFILENMLNVVRQCPFQCNSCRFYCNTEETFLLHWRSDLHNSVQHDESTKLTCTCCDFWCATNESMEDHLVSIDHCETVAMINGSVPVIIRRHRLLTCDTCKRSFRYNIQLRIHSKETNHPLTSTATDNYQSRISCDLCSQVFKSLIALQRHQLRSHGSKKARGQATSAPYFCSCCSIKFRTAREAQLHRRTRSHRQIVQERKLQEGGENELQRDCGYCGEKLKNLEEYKTHLIQYHYDLCHKCSLCGTVFPFRQGLGQHTKKRECQKKSTSKKRLLKKWNCTNCTIYSTNSHAEFIFHQVLHAGPVAADPNEAGTSTSLGKYRCPLCDKILPKDSMLHHIRLHTNERPFTCFKCLKCFSSRSTLKIHNKICTSVTQESDQQSNADVRVRKFICAECNEAFYTKFILSQHILVHTGKSYKCGIRDCPTILRTPNELKNHRKIVHETNDQKYKCNECTYSTKIAANFRRHQKRHRNPASQVQFPCPYNDCCFITRIASQLKRHYRVHTGVKPFKCRLCDYASNNLENLRKHVLSTKRHPGSMIYECAICTAGGSSSYKTNFSRKLRAHLYEAHPETFPTAKDATNYVAKIFDRNN